MFVIEMKPLEELTAALREGGMLVVCEGCREIRIPSEEITQLMSALAAEGITLEVLRTDFICNPEYSSARLGFAAQKIAQLKNLAILSCGAGVQTAAKFLKRKVLAAGNTIYINGFQGVTPLDYGCAQCGECMLNFTGGICPVTACSKGLLNGSCGGAKDGKCEVGPEKDCGWEKIYRRLEQQGRAGTIADFSRIRDYKKLLRIIEKQETAEKK